MTDEAPNNAGDAEAVKAAKEKQRDRAFREREEMRFLLGRVEFRRFVMRLLGQTTLFYGAYIGSGSEVYFNEGKRYVALEVVKELEAADPTAFAKMLLEVKQGGLKHA